MNTDYSKLNFAPMPYPLPIIEEMAARNREVVGLAENGGSAEEISAAIVRSQTDVKRLVDAVAAIGILARQYEELRTDFLLDTLKQTLGQR